MTQLPGDFGRVPRQTLDLFTRVVSTARKDILSSLPPSAQDQLRARTLEMVLGTVLKDWRENGNTEGLRAQDVADLKSFVALAVSQAGSDFQGKGLAVYEAVLEALLEDWVANWNANGVEGPPKRE